MKYCVIKEDRVVSLIEKTQTLIDDGWIPESLVVIPDAVSSRSLGQVLIYIKEFVKYDKKPEDKKQD